MPRFVRSLRREGAERDHCKTEVVPWRPSFENPIRNIGLDAYRHRAARLRDAAGNLGTMYVEPELIAEQTAGHLWWRKWERAREQVTLWIDDPDGGPTDVWVMPDDLDEEIDRWEQCQFDLGGETFELVWLDDDASSRLRQQLAIDDPSDC
jgi:hypothetical protein